MGTESAATKGVDKPGMEEGHMEHGVLSVSVIWFSLDFPTTGSVLINIASGERRPANRLSK
jgi:hypothetical protein